MNVYFETDELEDLYKIRLENLRGKQEFPIQIIKQYKQAVFYLTSISKVEDLRMQRGCRFEYLKGDLKGKCSMRLNKQYRLIITITDKDTINIIMINEISKHYEK